MTPDATEVVRLVAQSLDALGEGGATVQSFDDELALAAILLRGAARELDQMGDLVRSEAAELGLLLPNERGGVADEATAEVAGQDRNPGQQLAALHRRAAALLAELAERLALRNEGSADRMQFISLLQVFERHLEHRASISGYYDSYYKSEA